MQENGRSDKLLVTRPPVQAHSDSVPVCGEHADSDARRPDIRGEESADTWSGDKSTESVFGFCDIPGYHDAEWVNTKFGGTNPTECWKAYELD